MRKALKILHTVASGGLIGGLMAYMILLLAVDPGSLAAYADLRAAIAAVSNYVLLPSLAVALVTGLFSMAMHPPFLNKPWAWIKAGLGILMFKGVLTIVGAKADHAASVSAKIAAGEAAPGALDGMLTLEWYTLATVMALCIANVVLGVWRPNRLRRARTKRVAANESRQPTAVPLAKERVKPAA